MLDDLVSKVKFDKMLMDDISQSQRGELAEDAAKHRLARNPAEETADMTKTNVDPERANKVSRGREVQRRLDNEGASYPRPRRPWTTHRARSSRKMLFDANNLKHNRNSFMLGTEFTNNFMQVAEQRSWQVKPVTGYAQSGFGFGILRHNERTSQTLNESEPDFCKSLRKWTNGESDRLGFDGTESPKQMEVFCIGLLVNQRIAFSNRIQARSRTQLPVRRFTIYDLQPLRRSCKSPH